MKLNFKLNSPLCLLILLLVYSGNYLLAQCDFEEDYTTNTGWTQVGVDVEILNGALHFLNGATDQTMQRRVHAQLGTTLDSHECWVAEVEFTPVSVGSKNNLPYTGHVPLALTAGTQEPYRDCPDVPCTGLPNGTQDGIMVTYIAYNPPDGDLSFRIHARNSGLEYQSTPNSIIAPYLDTTYYIRLSRNSETQVELEVYWDASRTNQLSTSPVFLTIPADLTGLTTVQHGNMVRGEHRRQLTGSLDNLCVNWTSLALSDTLNLPNDTSLCSGDSIQLNVGMGSHLSYLWNTGSTDSVLTITQPGIYIATVQGGCAEATDTIIVSSANTRGISLPPDTVLCLGDSFVVNIGQGADASYWWNTGSTDSIIIISSAGTYVASVTKTCTVYDTLIVTSLALPQKQLRDTIVCNNEAFALTFVADDATYLWNTGETTPSIYPTTSGTYGVVVTTACGEVRDSAHVQIEECECRVFLPNAFSPNDDGVNDVFAPKATCPGLRYVLTVFDRWGTQVAEITEKTTPWDGSFQGKRVPMGVYSYRFIYEYPQQFRREKIWEEGYITVLK